MAEVEVPNVKEFEEHRERSFSRRVAVVTAMYAVVLAIASVGGSYAMKEMILSQQQASDQWAFYQAKVIREHLYRSQRLQVELALAEPSTLKPTERAKYEALSRQLGSEEQRYSTEKKEVEAEAKKLEHERDYHRTRDPYFDYGEVFLQIAIVAASVSILAVSRWLFGFSLVLALIGALLTVNGFTLFLHLPTLGTH